jgi:hypothetical protein
MMALKKQIEMETGITVEYWKLHSLSLVAGQTVQMTFVGYKNASARQAGKIPAAQWVTSVPTDAFVSEEKNAIRRAYILTKGEDQFSGAEDC